MKESFNSRITELDGFAQELKMKSHLSFEKTNSQVTIYMTDLEDVSVIICAIILL
jgi:kinesin family member 11